MTHIRFVNFTIIIECTHVQIEQEKKQNTKIKLRMYLNRPKPVEKTYEDFIIFVSGTKCDKTKKQRSSGKCWLKMLLS